MSYKYVPPKPTAIPESTILIDFCFYKDDKCELEKMNKTGVVKKILRFIKQVGQCQDGTELQSLLIANNSCDMSASTYQSLAPQDLKIYEVWHEKDCGERIFYTRSGNRFYPIVFLQRH